MTFWTLNFRITQQQGERTEVNCRQAAKQRITKLKWCKNKGKNLGKPLINGKTEETLFLNTWFDMKDYNLASRHKLLQLLLVGFCFCFVL